MNTSNETLEQEAPVKNPKAPKNPKPTPRTRPARREEPAEAIAPANPAKMADDLPADEKNPPKKLSERVDWFDLKSIKKSKIKEEPLHIMVYFKVMIYPKDATETPKRKLKIKIQEKQRHGKITFSHYLSNKYGLKCKVKFGALDGKLIFCINKNDGITPKMASRSTEKICVSCADIVEIIYNKYGLKEGSHSVYFKLQDLGNDFYLIDEIIK